LQKTLFLEAVSRSFSRRFESDRANRDIAAICGDAEATLIRSTVAGVGGLEARNVSPIVGRAALEALPQGRNRL
jgi:hypothetical protein